jgi:hypothetical protein
MVLISKDIMSNQENTIVGHTHVDEKGIIHKCYHECKSTFKQSGFWLGVTVSFPLEHFLYEKVFPFYLITQWMGL